MWHDPIERTRPGTSRPGDHFDNDDLRGGARPALNSETGAKGKACVPARGRVVRKLGLLPGEVVDLAVDPVTLRVALVRRAFVEPR
jgi:hypothetical protein